MKSYSKIPQLYQSVLDIPMFEAVGALAHDISRQAALNKTMTLAGATIAWAKWPLSNTSIIDFNSATPDRLELAAAASTDLNFLAGDFSGMAWVYPQLLVGNIRNIFCKGGVEGNNGWEFTVAGGNGAIYFSTYQAAAHQDTLSAIGQVVLNTWYLLGFSRTGTVAKLYKNGVDVTLTSGAHVNPDDAAARDFHVGSSLMHAAGWDGYIWRPCLFSRLLLPTEFKEIFELERGLFGA